MNVTNAPYVRRTPTPLLFRVTPRRTLFLPAGSFGRRHLGRRQMAAGPSGNFDNLSREKRLTKTQGVEPWLRIL
jgi:hypothetical protein